jgi:hypothetical protein
MPWSSYARQPDGRVRLVDDTGGTLDLLPSPSVDAEIARIDGAMQPMVPEVVPDGIVTAKSAPMAANRAQMITPPAAPVVNVAPPAAGNPLVPPAPIVAAPAPAPGSPLAPMAAPPAPTGPAPAAPAAPPPPAGPSPAGLGAGKIVRGQNWGNVNAEDQLRGAQANLLIQQANEELKGSPGRFVPGGTFPTGRTEQFAPGPDPLATAEREAAERKLARVDDALTWVETHRQQDLGDAAQAEAARAAERQRQLDELNARQQQKLGGVLEQIDTGRRELADAKIDPDRKLKEMSTGQRATTALLMLLGGFGKALAGEDGDPMAMRVLDESIKMDIDLQREAIDRKRGNLNTLGEIYRLTREQFGDERMAQDAAYLAGLEIYKAKIQKVHAEADAAMGVETQYDADGRIIASNPYSIKAQRLLAALDVEQARLREQLSQAAAGQVSQQFATVQDRIEGGKAPNREKAAKLLGEAAKAAGSEGQQVTYGDQKFKLGAFVEPGEGKALRGDLGGIENLKADIALLEKELKDHPVDSKTFNKSKVDGLMERISSKGNVVLGQGAKNNDEAARWNAILGGVMTNGVGAVQDMSRWADDMAKRKLDQVNAKPAGAGPKINVPQELQDKASGARPMGGGGGVVGLPRGAAPQQRPSSPVVRSTGAAASPLDRAGAAVVQLREAKDDKARAKTVTLLRSTLRDSLQAGQLGESEYKAALTLADAGDVDGLLGFLGRMRGAVPLAPGAAMRPDDLNRAISNRLLMSQLDRAGEPALRAMATPPAALTTVVQKTKGKLLPTEKRLWLGPRPPRSRSTGPMTRPCRCLRRRLRRSCARESTGSRKTRPCPCRRRMGPGRRSPARRP